MFCLNPIPKDCHQPVLLARVARRGPAPPTPFPPARLRRPRPPAAPQAHARQPAPAAGGRPGACRPARPSIRWRGGRSTLSHEVCFFCGLSETRCALQPKARVHARKPKRMRMLGPPPKFLAQQPPTVLKMHDVVLSAMQALQCAIFVRIFAVWLLLAGIKT